MASSVPTPPQEGFETLESTYGPEYVNSVLKRWCNRSWPAQELKTLVNAINEGKSFQQAAKLIPKKSVQACRIKAKRLLAREPGLFSRKPGQRKYRRAPKRKLEVEDQTEDHWQTNAKHLGVVDGCTASHGRKPGLAPRPSEASLQLQCH